MSKPDLITQWGAAVTPDNAHRDDYPRPQMARDAATTVTNLNGLWELQLAAGHVDESRRGVFDDAVPFGVTLNQTILVPYPLEACLSGAFRWPLYSRFLYYRLLFDAPAGAAAANAAVLLHFGAVDWNATVYLNGAPLAAPHLGGYDAFSFDVTSALRAADNELIVAVFDPSEKGDQPAGKQWIAAIGGPGSVFYTPNSGIWQTVWLETVAAPLRIEGLKLRGSTTHLHLTVTVAPPGAPGLVNGTISLAGAAVATFAGAAGEEIVVAVPSPQLWAPGSPTLYDLAVSAAEPGGSAADMDTVTSYFGMREVGKANFTNSAGDAVVRPTLNGQQLFLSGVLDQRFWPDGIYSAPSDDALASDIQAMLDMGFNAIRAHQNYGSARWFFHADRLGMVVLQDMVGIMAWNDGALNVSNAKELFLADFKTMIDQRYNAPSILQWTAFNEGDCVQIFDDVPAVMDWLIAYDPSRNTDTNSGGGANSLNIGDVQDSHNYPAPGQPQPNAHQYAEQGEYGGLGFIVPGHEWVVGGCGAYAKLNSSDLYISQWSGYVDDLKKFKQAPGTSIAIYTQLTDVETECDGWLNYDRTAKFSPAQVAQIRAINEALIAS
jgi:beta-galactosidase/beta-glucuronidase